MFKRNSRPGWPAPAPAPRADTGAPAADAVFDLHGTAFAVNGTTILSPLRLSIPAGRVVGIIGHNGSGKSTLAKLLSRQLRPSSGCVTMGGLPVQGISPREFARKVAYLPQQIPLASGMTVKELVALGRYPWLGAFRSPGQADLLQIEKGMQITMVAVFADRLVDTLSGGERQRVWLAMLIAQGAQCLVLDEPISALDIRHQVEILSLLKHLCREEGASVIVVLHDVYMAGRYCDELIALKGGQVVARGSSSEILTPAALKAIYDVEMDVMIHPGSGNRVVCLRQ